MTDPNKQICGSSQIDVLNFKLLRLLETEFPSLTGLLASGCSLTLSAEKRPPSLGALIGAATVELTARLEPRPHSNGRVAMHRLTAEIFPQIDVQAASIEAELPVHSRPNTSPPRETMLLPKPLAVPPTPREIKQKLMDQQAQTNQKREQEAKDKVEAVQKQDSEILTRSFQQIKQTFPTGR